jgi:membrane protein implicated in regulation of membrane protease activity
MVWLVMAGVMLILEIFSGTFYLLMLAIGMVAGAVAAWAGLSNPLQMLCVAVVGIVAVLGLRFFRREHGVAIAAAADPSVNLDIGQALRVEQWTAAGAATWSARVNYRGAMWDVELKKGEAPQAGLYIIREVHGSRLLVTADAAQSN